MSDEYCPECRSDASVGLNTTNYAAKYYCSCCEQSFNPPAWTCPECGDTDAVSRNPFDDPWQYYCYDCDLAFNRLGPSFDDDRVEYGTIETTKEYLTLNSEIAELSRRGEFEIRIILRNRGQSPIQTQGKQSIALQYQVNGGKWWTLYGNPERYSSEETSILFPNQRFQWVLNITSQSILSSNFSITNNVFPSGTYRVLYWGFQELETVLATRISIEFENGW